MSPTTLGIALALGSAGLTAAAHYIWKASGDRLVMRVMLSGFAGLFMLPVLFVVGLPSAAVWPWLLGSVAAHLGYQLAVIRAYDTLDFSLAFPIARGVLPVVSGLLGVVLLGDRISVSGWLAISLVSLGLLMIARSAGRVRIGAGLAAAALAGALGAIYNLVDAGGVRVADPAVQFIAWMFVLDPLAIGTVALFSRGWAIWPRITSEWRRGILGGGLTVLYYGAFLLSLDYLAIGIASALRETSVFFATLLAWLALKENVPPLRWAGIALGLFGTVLIVVVA